MSASIVHPSFLHIAPSSHFLESIRITDESPEVMKFDIFARKIYPPSSVDMQIVSTYITSKGDPMTASITLPIPLILACRLKAATKSADFKIVLDTEFASPIPLTEIFDEFLFANSENGVDVSVCNFHVLSNLLLNYICKLHWNLNTKVGLRK